MPQKVRLVILQQLISLFFVLLFALGFFSATDHLRTDQFPNNCTQSGGVLPVYHQRVFHAKVDGNGATSAWQFCQPELSDIFFQKIIYLTGYATHVHTYNIYPFLYIQYLSISAHRFTHVCKHHWWNIPALLRNTMVMWDQISMQPHGATVPFALGVCSGRISVHSDPVKSPWNLNCDTLGSFGGVDGGFFNLRLYPYSEIQFNEVVFYCSPLNRDLSSKVLFCHQTFIAQLNIQCPDLKQGANEVRRVRSCENVVVSKIFNLFHLLHAGIPEATCNVPLGIIWTKNRQDCQQSSEGNIWPFWGTHPLS